MQTATSLRFATTIEFNLYTLNVFVNVLQPIVNSFCFAVVSKVQMVDTWYLPDIYPSKTFKTNNRMLGHVTFNELNASSKTLAQAL